jgi:hypothetical protein
MQRWGERRRQTEMVRETEKERERDRGNQKMVKHK